MILFTVFYQFIQNRRETNGLWKGQFWFLVINHPFVFIQRQRIVQKNETENVFSVISKQGTVSQLLISHHTKKRGKLARIVMQNYLIDAYLLSLSLL